MTFVAIFYNFQKNMIDDAEMSKISGSCRNLYYTAKYFCLNILDN